MKKALTMILGLVCVIALMLGCAENPDGSCNIAWTLSCLAIAAASGLACTKLSPSIRHE